MPLTVTTDHDAIAAVLDRFLAADPVAGTLLGTIRWSLEGSAWAAVDGERLAVRSAAEYPVAVVGEWPPQARAQLLGLLGELPPVRGLSGAEDVVAPLVEALRGQRTVSHMEQGLFRLEELTPPAGVTGSAVLAVEGQRELVRAWFGAFAAEAGDLARRSDRAADRAVQDGGCWLWLDGSGEPVSLAARRPVVAGSARIGPVYTPPEHRGVGYGSAITAAATRDILDDGGIPVLFTDLANPTSNKIYRQLGYVPVDRRIIVTFD